MLLFPGSFPEGHNQKKSFKDCKDVQCRVIHKRKTRSNLNVEWYGTGDIIYSFMHLF